MRSPPLADGVSAVLQSDATAALAAAFVIASHHPGILQWAARMVGAEPSAAAPPPNSHGNGAKGLPRARKTHSGDRRVSKRDRDDEALLEAMRQSPDASIGDLAAAIGKSRSSVVTALGRLRDAGLAESIEGKWRLVEEPAPALKETPTPWTKPLRGTDRAAVHHLT
jgi:DNA-binding transcriptional ArsR family regulator